MKFTSWLFRKIKGPLWYLKNIILACWDFDLSDMANKRGQTSIKRFMYRLILSAAAVIEVVLMVLISAILSLALFALPIRWSYTKAREIWFRDTHFTIG